MVRVGGREEVGGREGVRVGGREEVGGKEGGGRREGGRRQEGGREGGRVADDPQYVHHYRVQLKFLQCRWNHQGHYYRSLFPLGDEQCAAEREQTHTHTHTIAHSLMHTHTHTHTLTIAHSLMHTHTHTHSSCI